MALPIDPSKIKKAADEVLDEVASNFNVNVYVDPTANEDMVFSMKDHFDTSDDHVQINYINMQEHKLRMDLDPAFAIILAGADRYSVLTYQALQVKEVPVLIMCIDPHLIVNAAKASGVDVRKGDVICPSLKKYTWVEGPDGASIDFNDYNEGMDASLKSKLTDWLYYYSEAVQISFAAHFPFLRSAISIRLINACAIENAGVGVLKILPGADMPLMTLNQARMLLELAGIYGYDISSDRIIEMVVLVLSAFGFRYLSNYVNDNSPIPEFVVDAVFGFGGTELIGFLAREYFSRGLAPEGLVEKCKSFFKK